MATLFALLSTVLETRTQEREKGYNLHFVDVKTSAESSVVRLFV
jgi:hypothetical protein